MSPRDIPGQDDDEADMQAAAVLTLRDYFAARAMQIQPWLSPGDTYANHADRCYAMADAMLRARRE